MGNHSATRKRNRSFVAFQIAKAAKACFNPVMSDGAAFRGVRGEPATQGNPRVSDIGLDFPFWFIAGYFVVMGWYVSVPAMVVLGLIGCSAKLARRWRVAAFGTAALLAAPFMAGAVFALIDHAKDKTSRALQAELHRTLDHDETVTGLALPAGSEIDFTDQSRSQILSVRLPAVTDIRGVKVTGMLTWQDFGQVWQGTLAGDQIVGGFPCVAGPVSFDGDGAVHECRLAAAHGFLGFTLPPGTTLTRGADPAHWKLQLPNDAGLQIPALAATAPPGATLEVAQDGRLERASSGNGATMVVRGVPLDSMNLFVRGDRVVAPLKEPFAVGGEIRPADTAVSIDLTTGEVALAGKNWWLSP
jgi:hypothetical protein